jgi:hypothetical protein
MVRDYIFSDGILRFVVASGLFVILLFNGGAFSQTCSSVAPSKKTNNNGDWNDPNDWTPNGVPGTYNAGTDTYTIAAGVVVEIANNFDLGSNLRIFGTVLITGKLVVTSSKKIFIETGGLLTCCETTYCGGACQACGNSDQLDIGGYTWKGGDGPIPGPATMSSAGLPVDVVNFKAEASENGIDLSWSTLTEKNFQYFSIERSIDGKDFFEIAQVEGHGDSRVRQDYSFTDEAPFNGRSYYRLKSVDFDLYTEYFDIVTVDFKGNRKVVVYPNPSSGASIEVTINFNPGESARLIVLDGIGAEILNESVSASKTKIVFPKRLDPGVYIVKYVSSDFEKVYRFVVTH